MQEQNPTSWDKICRNIFSNFAGVAVSCAIGLFLLPFVVRRIGATDFAIWTLSNILVGYMGILDVGLAPALMKNVAESLAKDDNEELNKIASTIFAIYLLAGVVAGVGMFLIGLIGAPVFHIPAQSVHIFTGTIWILGMQTVVGFPMSIWQGLMGGLQDFHIRNTICILTNVLRGLGTILLLGSGFGLIALVWLGFGVAVIGWFGNMFWVRRRLRDLRIEISQFDFRKAKELFCFSGSMLIGTIAGKVVQGGSRIVIGLFLPVAAITSYEVGARIPDYSRFVSYPIINTILPATSELNARNQLARLQTLYLIGTKYILMIFGLMSVGLVVFGRQFIKLWIGSGFEDSVWVMYVLATGNLFYSQTIMALAILPGMGRLRLYTLMWVIYPVVFIILSIGLVLTYGVVGVALANTLTIVITESVLIVYAPKILQLSLSRVLEKCYIPAALVALPVIPIAWCLRSYLNVGSWMGLALGTLVLLIIGLLSILVFGTSKEERGFVKNRIQWGTPD